MAVFVWVDLFFLYLFKVKIMKNSNSNINKFHHYSLILLTFLSMIFFKKKNSNPNVNIKQGMTCHVFGVFHVESWKFPHFSFTHSFNSPPSSLNNLCNVWLFTLLIFFQPQFMNFRPSNQTSKLQILFAIILFVSIKPSLIIIY